MIRKPVRLIFCILFSVAILVACASPTPMPTVTTIHTATATLPPPTQTTIPPTLTPLPPSPTEITWISPRGYHAAAYDSHCDRVIVFSGQENGVLWVRDTWTYDLATNSWENMSPSQMPPLTSVPWGDSTEGPMAYDEKADRTIFFDDNIYGDAKTLATKTWAYDCSSNTWTNLNAQGAPDGLLGARMVYDSKADRMILFGGIIMPMPADWMSGDWTQSNETWAYDYQTNTWTNMHPKVSPPGENYFGMDYDADSDLVLAWIQPNNIAGPTGDNILWAYDYAKNTWTSYPITQPAYRIYNIAAYVPTVKKTFYFGGTTMVNETPFNEMWTYDSATNTWAQISTSTGPGPRAWATLTYSSKADKLVLIGGGADRDHLTAEVWIYDPHAKTWTQVGPK